MAFTVKDWQNAPSTTSPINAVALENMETRLSDYTDTRVDSNVALTAGSGYTIASGTFIRNQVIDASSLSASALFTVTGASNILIENVRITGLGKTKTAMQFTGCTNVTVRNVTITSGGKGITFDACDSVVAESNNITLTTDATSGFIGHGILVYNNSVAHSGYRICNNTINAARTYAHGIYGWGSDSAVLANPVNVSRMVVTGNIVTTAHGGIWFSKCQNVSVTGNTVRDCSDVGIDFEGCLDCVASGNELTNVKSGAIATLYNSKRIVFTGNEIRNNTDTGSLGGGAFFTESTWIAAYIRDTCEDITISGNQFTSTITGNKSGEIHFWRNAQSEGSRRVNIIGNSFYNMYVNSAGRNRDIAVIGNRFYSDYQPTGAVWISQVDGVHIARNSFSLASNSSANTRGNSPIAVYQNSAASTPRVTNVLIEDNHILNYPNVGIEIDTFNGTDYTATFIIRNNEVGVYWTRASAAATQLITGNVLPTAPQTASSAQTW